MANMVTVRENRDGKIFVPQQIPIKREDLTLTKLLIAVIIYIVTIILTSLPFRVSFIYNTGLHLFTISLVIIYELLERLLTTYKEKDHLISRYNGSWLKLFQESLTFRKRVVIVFLLSVFYLYLNSSVIWEETEKNISLIILLPVAFISALLIADFLKIKECGLEVCKLMDSLSQYGLDCGNAMAFMFFTGFLNIILPHKQGDLKGLKENIEDFADKNKVHFLCKKLMILIPFSANCPNSLDIYDGIEVSKTLEPLTMTRASSQGRVYKISVYKLILEDNKRGYICAEYVTPLKTFSEVIKLNDKNHSAFYEKYLKEVVLNLYLKLRDLVIANDMTDLCEIICYHDNGKVNVKDLILERIEKINKKRK